MIERLPVAQISLDESLRYRDELARFAGADALRASIGRLGLLQPLLLEKTGAGPRLLAGFRRLEVARELSLVEVPVRYADPSTGTLALLTRAVEEHAGQAINLRERLRALRAAERLGAAPEQVLSELMPALGLAAEASLLEDLRRVLGLPGSLLDLLVGKAFSLRRCLPFARLSAEEGELFAGVARRLGLGGRPLEEALTAVLEIAARDGVAVRQLLDELSLAASASTKQALSALEERRHPETTRRRRALEEASDSLAPGRALLRYDPSLSSEAVEVVIRIRSLEELEAALRAVGSDGAREVLRRALEQL